MPGIAPAGAALPRAVEVVVVGGGVIGTSIAWHQAEAGAQVLLLERGELGGGASGRNAGMLYQGEGRDRPEGVIPLTMRTRQRLPELLARWGADRVAFTPCGTLDVALDATERDRLAAMVRQQAAAGLDVRLIDGAEARRIAPALSEAVIAARYCPSDAKLIPYELAFAAARAAAKAGATIRTGIPVTELVLVDDQIQGVRTPAGTVRCRWVVLATNAWAPELGATVGLALPIRPLRGQILVTVPGPWLVDQNLLTFGSQAYWRQMPDGQIVLGGGYRHDPDVMSLRLDLTPAALRTTAADALRVTPGLRGRPVVRAWAGTMGITPDGVPLIGPLARPRGLAIAAGLSGSGMPFVVAAGELIAAALGGPPTDLPTWGTTPARYDL